MNSNTPGPRSNFLFLLIMAASLVLLAIPAGIGAQPADMPANAPVAAPAAAPTWTMIWNDEFSGSGRVDTAKWRYDIGHGYPGGPANWGTGEVEYMTDSTANVYQAGGNLYIKPLCCWTSGRIETNRDDFQPPAGGLLAVEGRIQMPNITGAAAQGYWPAFWMLGTPYRGNWWNWPSIGEIDILENVQGINRVWATMHCGTSPGGPCNEKSGIGGSRECPGTSCQAGFHTYRMEWDKSISPNQIRFYVDGIHFHTVSQNQVDATTWNNATNHGYFIILNVAMGGEFPAAFGGGPYGHTASGIPMLVDYVRVYTGVECATCPTPIPPTQPPLPPSTPYLGAPISLPGTIQAENFDKGGEGVGYHETTPGNQGGYAYRNDGNTDVDFANNCGICVNYIAPSEWLRYAVSVAGAGTYTLNVRHAGPGGGVYHVETTTGQNLTGPITQANTGSWDTYATYSRQVTLPAGNYGIRLVFDSCNACNLNNIDWISFTGGTIVTPTPTPPPTTPPPGSNTGWVSPGAQAAQSGGDGNGFQTTPANALSDNGTFAADADSGNGTSTSCTSTNKDRHAFYTYPLSIPAGSTIRGLEVRLDARADSASNAPFMCVQLSWNNGASWTTIKQTGTLGTTEASYIVGGPTDTWGRAWTTGELSSANLRVRVINVSSSTSRDFFLDWVPVRVYYTSAVAPTPTTPADPTSTPVPGGTWAPGVYYPIGATVSYNSVNYRCQQAHTSQVGWEPPNTPALWVRL